MSWMAPLRLSVSNVVFIARRRHSIGHADRLGDVDSDEPPQSVAIAFSSAETASDLTDGQRMVIVGRSMHGPTHVDRESQRVQFGDV